MDDSRARHPNASRPDDAPPPTFPAAVPAFGTPPEFSVVIPNWQGETWVERAMSSMHLALLAAGRPGEVIVVDDASTDRGPAILRDRYPWVRLIVNPRNLGFGASVNRGVEAARGEFIVLLNNDLVVREEFFERVLEPFDEAAGGRDLFACSARTLTWDASAANHLCMSARWREGRIQPAWTDPPRRAGCLFAQGGSMAMRRDVFLKLGGLDPIFAPGYWEDYDLCWRAARAGWRIAYEPQAIAFHVGGGSMTKRFGAREVYLMRGRNHLIFEWLNLTDGRLLRNHLAWLARHVWREWRRGEGYAFTQSLSRAARRLPEVFRRRRERRAAIAAASIAPPRSDRRLLALGRGFRCDPTL